MELLIMDPKSCERKIHLVYVNGHAVDCVYPVARLIEVLGSAQAAQHLVDVLCRYITTCCEGNVEPLDKGCLGLNRAFVDGEGAAHLPQINRNLRQAGVPVTRRMPESRQARSLDLWLPTVRRLSACSYSISPDRERDHSPPSDWLRDGYATHLEIKTRCEVA
jgi:hypothetical protein